MKILITNHHLIDYGGSEVVTYELAKFLGDAGHRIVVYSPFTGKAARRIEELGVAVYDNLKTLRAREPQPDIIHAHHNITAIQARSAYPMTPMIFLCHGRVPIQEHPPSVDLGISRFLAVSERVRDKLVERGVAVGNIAIFRNSTDPAKFAPAAPIRKSPKGILVLDNYIHGGAREIVEEACGRKGLRLSWLGAGGKSTWNVEQEINKADLVITLGKGVLEAMSCGRAVIVYGMSLNRAYFGGMIEEAGIGKLAERNFAGKRANKFTADKLVAEIEKYDAGMGEVNRSIIVRDFNVNDRMKDLVAIYEGVLAGSRPAPVHIDPKELNFYQRELKSCYERLSGQRRDIIKVCEECESLRQDIGKMNAENAALATENAALSAQLERIRTSLVWKMTGPVRRIVRRPRLGARRGQRV